MDFESFLKLANRTLEQVNRFGVYGDLLTRMQRWVVSRCPFFVEPVLLIGYAALFFLLCGSARRAIVENLGTILPGSSRFVNWWRTYRVIYNFSESLTDAMRHRGDEDIIEWEIEGDAYLEELANSGSGAILLTAHMGNYDIAARVFADKFNRKVHAVRAPERQEDAQELRRKELEGGGSPENLVIRYNEKEAMLGAELAKAIGDGEVVAIQGDRVLFDVAVVDAPFDERHRLKIPKGPLVLSTMTRCPIYPVFFVRSGYRRYRVIARAPFECERKRGAAQVSALEVAAETWLEVLRPIMRKYWGQWYVFERAFENQGEGTQ